MMGLALLGSLLASILVVDARQQRQSESAARTVDACAAADTLLSQWRNSKDGFPRDASGETKDGAFRWELRRSLEHRIPEELGAEVLILSLRDKIGREPLVRVELLLPKESSR